MGCVFQHLGPETFVKNTCWQPVGRNFITVREGHGRSVAFRYSRVRLKIVHRNIRDFFF